MKIAIVAYIDIQHGMGAARRVIMLAQGLRNLGNDVHLVGATWGSACLNEQSLHGIRVHQPSTTGHNSAFLRAIMRRVQAWRTIIQLVHGGLEWVLLYNLGIDALPLAWAAKRQGLGLAMDNCDVRHRGGFLKPRQLFDQISYTLADHIMRPMADLNIVVSSYIEKLVRGQAPGTPVLVLPALIDTMIFRFDMKKARQFREKWSLGDIPIVAYLGGTQKFEGLSTLLQAARILVDEGSEFRILLAGETMRNRWHEDLPTRIHELKLENRVLFVGCLPTEEVVAAISASDVLVVPKQDVRANIAGFPQKLVEYLAAGKPVVATRVGDVPRYLTDRENALLCVPDDARALAQAISEPLHDKSLASYLGGAARKTAVQFFDVTVRTRDLVDALLACRIRSTKPHRALHQ